MQPPMETSYEDFEPFCKWRREHKCDTLEVHLPGFKRQQLKVQLSSSGVLNITGERQSDEDKMKRSRFRKEFPLSENCQPNQIHAKFSNGILYLAMPKEISNISGAGGNVSSGNRNKKIAMEIIVAISLAMAAGAYVIKYCQCSHLWN
ncbi:inactive protein RESTRICTED TEV MOVEMENT 2-like [Durio zibethinus]|uniref:Inactive protein RESTRICTED TEV MOVEMENT 2-like n=1 Tax=Durio zibethinus TaxID=66656 RepID=A0A6P5WX53_DURZI|nr:inactive protein RESTRICTED TEV MOVEMENT 2-like [Durio zibethinus]